MLTKAVPVDGGHRGVAVSCDDAVGVVALYPVLIDRSGCGEVSEEDRTVSRGELGRRRPYVIVGVAEGEGVDGIRRAGGSDEEEVVHGCRVGGGAMAMTRGLAKGLQDAVGVCVRYRNSMDPRSYKAVLGLLLCSNREMWPMRSYTVGGSAGG